LRNSAKFISSAISSPSRVERHRANQMRQASADTAILLLDMCAQKISWYFDAKRLRWAGCFG
jgi:hypothetical protein